MNKINDLLANIKMAMKKNRQNAKIGESMAGTGILTACNYIEDVLFDVENYLTGVLKNE